MNAEFPKTPREELELRLTALLLGELSEPEAASVRQAIAKDPELTKLHDDLKQTIRLVRVAATSPEQPMPADAAQLKLSEARRKKLLTAFAIPPLKAEHRKSKPSFQIRLVEVLAVLAITGLLAATFMPALSRAKRKAESVALLGGHQQVREGDDLLVLPDSDGDSARLERKNFGVESAAPSDSKRGRVYLPAYETGSREPEIAGVREWTEDAARSASPAENGHGLTPLNLQLPAPTLKGTPAALPRTLGDRNGTVTVLPPGSAGGGGGLAVRGEIASAGRQETSGQDKLASDNKFFREQVPPKKVDDHVNFASTTPTDKAGPLEDQERLAVNAGALTVTAPATPAVEAQWGVSDFNAVNGVPQERFALRGAAPAQPAPPAGGPVVADEVHLGSAVFSRSGRARATKGVEIAGDEFVRSPAPPPQELAYKADGEARHAFGDSDVRLGIALNQPQSGKPVTANDWYLGRTVRSEVQDGRLGEESRQATVTNRFAGSYAYSVLDSQAKYYDATVSEGQSKINIVLPKTSSEKPRAAGDVAVPEGREFGRGYAAGQAAGVPARTLRLPEEKETTQPYLAKKRELEQLLAIRRVLEMKIASEKFDVSLPKTSMVEIMDRATAETAPSKGLLARVGDKFAGTVERAARIRVAGDDSDIQGFTERSGYGAYDPYFIQTELEAMQSEAVLAKAAEKLNLSETWTAKRGAGDKLKTPETVQLLRKRLRLEPAKNTSLVEIRAKGDDAEEAAQIANAVAEAYRDYRAEQRRQLTLGGLNALDERYTEQEKKIAQVRSELAQLENQSGVEQADLPISKPSTNAPIPQPEFQTAENNFSTFSLNVSDVAFKLAAASLEKGQMPDAASVRSEEFINAFDYRDPEPAPGAPIAFAWERARYPFAHNRDLLRFSLKTAAAGRQAGRPLNIVLLLDNSGSMERADRVRIIREALRVLASQLQAQDKLSVVTFSRTPRLFADGVSGDKAREVTDQVSGITPQGGTNLEDAMNLAYQTALRHYLANGINRVVLLTDGAANLGDVEPESLKRKVEAHRQQGVALDCFGIGWEGFNDDLLEVLSRNGDGRYGFINSPEEAATEFASQLAGALKVAASDVKVQVEFNPKRVTSYRQIGYAKHQLKKEQFRDNTVDAAEIAAQEAGNALYTVEVNPAGQGPLCTVRVRFKIPGTTDYREQAWDVPFTGNAVSLEQASPAMRLAASAAAFSEWLVASPFASDVTPDRLLGYLSGVPGVYGADSRPTKLEWMIRQAKSIEGK